MISKTSVLRYLEIFLGKRFTMESPEFYFYIIDEISLKTFSRYYPKYTEGILITEKEGIMSYNPSNRTSTMYKYKIPNYGQDVEYLDIDNFYHPFNDRSGTLNQYSLGGNFVANIAMGRIQSLIPHVNSFYTAEFEPPDIIVINPPPQRHVDFTVVMKCVRPIHQILPNYKDLFMELVLCDVKMALYNKYLNLRSDVTVGGLEINTMLDEYSSAEQDRKDILERMRKDSMRNYQNMRSYFNKISY